MVGSHPLRVYRKDRGITQNALAKELGVHPLTVSRWEVGHRRIAGALLGLVAEKTGIPKRELRPDLSELLTEVGQ